MTQERYNKVLSQLETLYELMPQYNGRTLDNIVQNLEALKQELEKKIQNNLNKSKNETN